MTEPERKLWWLLRRKQLVGLRFRRQAPLGPFIADFFYPKARLVVELDGASHTSDKQIADDARRTRWLTRHGLRVVRFTNRELFEDPDRVADAIYLAATPPSVAHFVRATFPQGGRTDKR